MHAMFEGLDKGLKQAWTAAFRLDETAWDRLEVLREALETAPLNLTRLYGERYWVQGVGDALAILSYCDEWKRMIDIGTGAGFPGLVLAVARPQRSVVLVEARRKRADFLQVLVDRLGLAQVAVIGGRAEGGLKAGGPLREGFGLATARAIGPLRMTAELTLPAVAVGGLAVWPRGAGAEASLEAESQFVRELGGDAGRVAPSPAGWLVVVRKVRETPTRFPRERHLGR